MFFCFYCNNFTIGYNFGNMFTMQAQETQNVSNQSCLTASKRCRCSNNMGGGHYRMHLQNSDLYNFGINCYDLWPTNYCSSTFQKTKAVQRTFVLHCS